MGVEMTERFPFSVDTWTEFSSSKKKYHFLTHAHKDHTGGMVAHASYPVYCTSITKQIVRHRYSMLDESMFVELQVGESLLIDSLDDPFTVTAFDANHCPGAIMLLFEGDFGNVLHTGDCRLSSDCLSKLPRKFTVRRANTCKDCLDCLYLDCTFGRESFKMPSKYSAIRFLIAYGSIQVPLLCILHVMFWGKRKSLWRYQRLLDPRFIWINQVYQTTMQFFQL